MIQGETIMGSGRKLVCLILVLGINFCQNFMVGDSNIGFISKAYPMKNGYLWRAA